MSVGVQPYNNGYVTFTVTKTPVFVVPFSKTVPIQLISFNGSEVNNTNTILLNWTISSDKLISYFSLERMDESTGVYSEIVSIPSRGNSDSSPVYNYSDNSAPNGIKHYRLQPVLTNGSSFYSPIIMVDAIIPASLIVYPNPVISILTIKGLIPKKTKIIR